MEHKFKLNILILFFEDMSLHDLFLFINVMIKTGFSVYSMLIWFFFVHSVIPLYYGKFQNVKLLQQITLIKKLLVIMSIDAMSLRISNTKYIIVKTKTWNYIVIDFIWMSSVNRSHTSFTSTLTTKMLYNMQKQKAVCT